MRNAGPLFRNTQFSAAELHRHVVTAVVQPPEETERARVDREFAHFLEHAPVVDVLEVVEERASNGLGIRRARLACGHLQGAGSSGRHRQIRCGACYREVHQ